MNESELKTAIEGSVKDYSIWTIGITNDPERRKTEHDNEGKNTKYWKDWEADFETIAKNVEKHFLDKDMKGGTGGGDHATFVYIF